MTSTASKLAAHFRARAEALDYKGKKRDNALLDYWCGAATLATLLAGDADQPTYDPAMARLANQLSMQAALLISTRGYLALADRCFADE